jgi:hypothetical protein
MKRLIMTVAALVVIGFALPAQAQGASGDAVDAKTQSSGGKTWKTIFQDLKDAGLYVVAVDETKGIISMGTYTPLLCGTTADPDAMISLENKALKLIDEWMAGAKTKQKQQIVIAQALISRPGVSYDRCSLKK